MFSKVIAPLDWIFTFDSYGVYNLSTLSLVHWNQKFWQEKQTTYFQVCIFRNRNTKVGDKNLRINRGLLRLGAQVFKH